MGIPHAYFVAPQHGTPSVEGAPLDGAHEVAPVPRLAHVAPMLAAVHAIAPMKQSLPVAEDYDNDREVVDALKRRLAAELAGTAALRTLLDASAAAGGAYGNQGVPHAVGAALATTARAHAFAPAGPLTHTAPQAHAEPHLEGAHGPLRTPHGPQEGVHGPQEGAHAAMRDPRGALGALGAAGARALYDAYGVPGMPDGAGPRGSPGAHDAVAYHHALRAQDMELADLHQAQATHNARASAASRACSQELALRNAAIETLRTEITTTAARAEAAERHAGGLNEAMHAAGVAAAGAAAEVAAAANATVAALRASLTEALHRAQQEHAASVAEGVRVHTSATHAVAAEVMRREEAEALLTRTRNEYALASTAAAHASAAAREAALRNQRTEMADEIGTARAAASAASAAHIALSEEAARLDAALVAARADVGALKLELADTRHARGELDTEHAAALRAAAAENAAAVAVAAAATQDAAAREGALRQALATAAEGVAAAEARRMAAEDATRRAVHAATVEATAASAAAATTHAAAEDDARVIARLNGDVARLQAAVVAAGVATAKCEEGAAHAAHAAAGRLQAADNAHAAAAVALAETETRVRDEVHGRDAAITALMDRVTVQEQALSEAAGGLEQAEARANALAATVEALVVSGESASNTTASASTATASAYALAAPRSGHAGVGHIVLQHASMMPVRMAYEAACAALQQDQRCVAEADEDGAGAGGALAELAVHVIAELQGRAEAAHALRASLVAAGVAAECACAASGNRGAEVRAARRVAEADRVASGVEEDAAMSVKGLANAFVRQPARARDGRAGAAIEAANQAWEESALLSRKAASASYRARAADTALAASRGRYYAVAAGREDATSARTARVRRLDSSLARLRAALPALRAEEPVTPGAAAAAAAAHAHAAALLQEATSAAAARHAALLSKCGDLPARLVRDDGATQALKARLEAAVASSRSALLTESAHGLVASGLSVAEGAALHAHARTLHEIATGPAAVDVPHSGHVPDTAVVLRRPDQDAVVQQQRVAVQNIADTTADIAGVLAARTGLEQASANLDEHLTSVLALVKSSAAAADVVVAKARLALAEDDVAIAAASSVARHPVGRAQHAILVGEVQTCMAELRDAFDAEGEERGAEEVAVVRLVAATGAAQNALRTARDARAEAELALADAHAGQRAAYATSAAVGVMSTPHRQRPAPASIHASCASTCSKIAAASTVTNELDALLALARALFSEAGAAVQRE